MNFVTWSIRNPVPVIVLFIALTVAGVVSFPKLGVQDRPDIEFPAVIVTITYPGVAPTQMESEITRKVEDAVATIAGIEQMTSTVDEGASTTSHRVSVRHGPLRRARRRPRCNDSDPRRLAGRRQRADRVADDDGRRRGRDVERRVGHDVRHGALVVRRPHGVREPSPPCPASGA